MLSASLMLLRLLTLLTCCFQMLLLLVCILLTLDLTLASYFNNLINLIIRPAGRSRSFKWLGRGSPANAPLSIPRPIFIPRWIPNAHSQYTAKWVPTLPPTSNSASGVSQAHGFGAPKANSVIKGGSLPNKMVAPPIMKVESSNTIVALDINPRTPTKKIPANTSGFEAPHQDDIVTAPLIDDESNSDEYVTDLTTLLSVKEDPISTNIPILNVDVRNNDIGEADTSGFEAPHEDDIVTTPLIDDLSVAESITVLSMPVQETESVEPTSVTVAEPPQPSDTRRLFQVSHNDQFAEVNPNSNFIYAQPRLNNDVSTNNFALFSEAKSSSVQPVVPSGRAIPYPVAFPISPLGLTLDFPSPSEFSALQAGVRSSRAFNTSPYVPYGTRLHPMSRSYTKKAYYG